MPRLLPIAIAFAVAVSACGAPPLNEQVGCYKATRAATQLDCFHQAVALLEWPQLADQRCTATYIGQGWLLTAAHCVTYGRFADGRCAQDWSNTCFEAEGDDLRLTIAGETHRSVEVWLHPGYTYGGFSTTDDIALVRIGELLEARTGEQRIWPVELTRTAPATAAQLEVVGHGWDDQLGLVRRHGYRELSAVRGAKLASRGSFAVQAGDSGGPSLDAEGRVAGIHAYTDGSGDELTDMAIAHYFGAIDQACGGCLSAFTPPPPEYDAYDHGSSYCRATACSLP